MKKLFKSNIFKIFILIFLICGVCAYLFPESSPLYNLIKYTTYPFDKFSSRIASKFSDISYSFKKKEELQNEINGLKKEINKLRDETIDYAEVKRQNEQFLKYYHIKKENEDFKFAFAEVIGVNLADPFYTFTIDKGKNEGISVNDMVMTENGVVGYISMVGDIFSQVRTIFSPESKIGVTDTVTSEGGVIVGSTKTAGEKLTRMIFISKNDRINKGDIIVTSGVSGMYPKNLKLGKVKSTEYDEKESSYFAVIEPFEDFSNIKNVFVITDFKSKEMVTQS